MLTRRSVLTGAAAAAAGVAAGAPEAVGATTGARLRVGKVLARDLVVPWGLTFLPNGDALVGERRSGRVHRVSHHGGR